jgi:hypothetical protein
VLLVGLTSVSPWWVTAVLVWFCPVVLLVSSWLVWCCFARLHVGFFFLAGCVLVVLFVLGPRGLTEASWNFAVHLMFATGLTGRVHRCDLCRQSDRQKRSVLPVWRGQQAPQFFVVRVGEFWFGRLCVGS